MSNQQDYTSDERLLEYDTQYGKILYALDDGRPVGDGFFTDPRIRYMGIGNRTPPMSCGSCSLVGFCQFCVNGRLYKK